MSAVSTLKIKRFYLKYVVFLVFVTTSYSGFKPCAHQDYGNGNTVCVCNETYCDSVGKITLPELGQIDIFESNGAGARFHKITGNLTQRWINETEPDSAVTATINKQLLYQELLGFGGSFTDSVGINTLTLPFQLQQELIKGYFSEEGLDYNMARVPIGSSDFGKGPYSYSDVPDDFNLVNFKLKQEDLQYKIPFMQQALSVRKKPLLFFATPWNFPNWMMSNYNLMSDDGPLKWRTAGPYYKARAKYFVKYLQAYEEHNITFWGLTAQNEPFMGSLKECKIRNCQGFTPEGQRDFILLHLGPTLKAAGYGPDKIKLMILDDSTISLLPWTEIVLGNAEVAEYVSGIAFHWYTNILLPREILDMVHQMFPNKFLLSTEACYFHIFSRHLGSWSRAEGYASDIIEDLLHFTAGWVDWNLAVDLNGGPNWAGITADAAVIINTIAKEFYRQPMYYALGHFSKFLPKGTYRIGLHVSGKTKVKLAAFKRPDNGYVLIAVNRHQYNVTLTICDPDIGEFSHNVTGHSLQTYIWRPS